MILGEGFEKFLDRSPVSVMVRGILERVFDPEKLERVFTDNALLQYTRELTFAQCVGLMSDVVFRIVPSVGAWYKAHQDEVPVTRQAVYDKLKHLELPTAAGLVAYAGRELGACLWRMPSPPPPLLPGYRVRVLDGNHLAGTEHRVKDLRRYRAAALPGHALVFYDPQWDVATDVIPCEDAYAQERTLLPEVIPMVMAGDCIVADRNFCTLGFLFGIARRSAFFVIRHHASNVVAQAQGPRRGVGHDARGQALYEQAVRVTESDTGATLIVRRITVQLHTPTRPGETELHILTNLPVTDAPAALISTLYADRWTIGVSREGSLTQSVQVRPKPRDSGFVAREAPGRESKPVKPSDNTLCKERAQRSRLQRTVNADVASLHATPVAEPVDNVRRQQGPSERSLPRRSSPAGYQRRHGTKGERATGEVRGVRRRKLAVEAWPITESGKWLGWPPDGGSGRSTDNPCAAKRTGREGPGPGGNLLYKERQG
jgi:hypothetical protein